MSGSPGSGGNALAATEDIRKRDPNPGPPLSRAARKDARSSAWKILLLKMGNCQSMGATQVCLRHA
jgi:primosomal protein N''